MSILGKKKKRLVEMAEEVVNNKADVNNLTLTKLSNLLMMSMQACCIEEVKNFIYYQMGRGKNGISKGFGNNLIKKLDEIGNEKLDDEDKMIMVRYFFGYLKRYGYYKLNS